MINDPTFQRYMAIAIVVIAAAWLLVRLWMKRKTPGCGGDCGCGSGDLKKHLKAGSRKTGRTE